MITKTLTDAREYEQIHGTEVPEEKRPLFHLSTYIGWMNDPNGFSFYNGVYHLFYQYYPYARKWGPMHWGHATSRDLLHWDYQPCVLAPDTPYDKGGCFSGSAVAWKDGKHLLMYTGICETEEKTYQVQCLAVGDGKDYEKLPVNPVIEPSVLPEGTNGKDFRDPKLFVREDGTYGCVISDGKNNGLGRVHYFESFDGITWKYRNVLYENDGTYGTMLECPDYFELDGHSVLLTSPMDMKKTDAYYNGNGNLCLIGREDPATGKLIPETDHPIDTGIDFYATQTIQTEDGRRVMVAWMQNWETITYMGDDLPWIGQMCTPRELSVRNNRLYQQPIRELEALRQEKVSYQNVTIDGWKRFDGVKGRTYELQIAMRPKHPESFDSFEIHVAENEQIRSVIAYNWKKTQLTFDRSRSGTNRNVVHERSSQVLPKGGKLNLRIILDRYSCEIFVNDGEQVMSHAIYSDINAEEISFLSNGTAIVDVTGWRLSF